MPEMNNKQKILVVDDEEKNVKLLTVRLSANGYDVLKAYSGEEAIKIALNSMPDVILLDIMMPGMDGYEVTEQLKKDLKTNIIPIVLVTALEGVEDKVKGLDAGADDFLTKPVNQTELLVRVRSLIKLKRLQEELMAKTDSRPPSAFLFSNEVSIKEKNTILIVEDDEKTAKNYSYVLKTAGYTTVAAKDSAEAMRTIDQTVPDLILLDILLPDISGFELLTRLKKNTFTENVPVIITSAISELETKIKGIEIGADDYLIKPVNRLEMLARVNANIRKYIVQQKLRSDLDTVFKQAITDPLTELYNRQYLVHILERYIASSKRSNKVFSLIMLDIDHFKNINDTFGHLVGDSVLKELAIILKEKSRAADIVSRYGGEEFIIVLSDTDIHNTLNFAERLRDIVESQEFSDVGEEKITISIGITEFHSEDNNMEAIIKRADKALYMAKAEGRNRINEG